MPFSQRVASDTEEGAVGERIDGCAGADGFEFLFEFGGCHGVPPSPPVLFGSKSWEDGT